MNNEINQGKCIASMVLGIVGIVFCAFPIVGIALNVVGLVLGSMEMKKGAKGMATAGVVCSIVGLSLATIYFLIACVGFGCASLF